MNMQHPDDRQLQRYLNKSCSEQVFHRLQQHLDHCPDCKVRLHAFVDLDLMLDELPLFIAPAGLEDSVMRAIQGARQPVEMEKPVRLTHIARFRSEMVHCFIATAATFLFVSTGLWSKLVSMNPVQWGHNVQSQVSMIETVIHRISVQFLS